MKLENVKAFIASLKTAQLVALYNLAVPKAQVKKFSDRATAEARLFSLITGYLPEGASDLEANPGYELFFEDFATVAARLGVELPAPPEPEPEPAPPAKRERKARAKAEKSPHLNLRCAHCTFYAKTTVAMMKLGRLACPVEAGHGLLLTAEERNEKRGIGGKK